MRARTLRVALFASLLVLAGCGSGSSDAGDGLRVYTSVTQDTVDAVVASFEQQNPEVEVEILRAPTGELTARIAAELRSGGVQADVLWLTDPLSMQQYTADGLLADWEPANAEAVPDDLQTATFWGTRILNMVIVQHRDDVTPLNTWDQLVNVTGKPIAIPDPGFAGSAFGALAAFGLNDDYGIAFYRSLADAGAVEVASPGEVLNGVAEGLYAAGMTLTKVARDAIDAGSPLVINWPMDGAVAIYSPIAVVQGAANAGTGRSFVEHVLSSEGQAAIAATGWQPIRADVASPDEGPRLPIDWQLAFERRDELLAAYRAVFDE